MPLFIRVGGWVFVLPLSAKHSPGGYDESIFFNNPSAQSLVGGSVRGGAATHRPEPPWAPIVLRTLSTQNPVRIITTHCTRL